MDDLEEPTYVDIDDAGRAINEREIDLQARMPDTDFEKALISVHPSQKRFTTKAQHKRAKKIEERFRTGTPEGKVYKAYVWMIIKWAKEKRVGLEKCIRALENQDRLIQFTIEHGNEILKKKSPADVREELSARGIANVGELYDDD